MKRLVNISWMVSTPDSLKRYSLWKSFQSRLQTGSITASKYDSQWHHARAIIRKIQKETLISTYDQSTFLTPFMKGSDTMDVDGLNKEQILDHMKRSLCFGCHLPGHNAKAHKKTGNYQFKKPNGKDVYDKIRALITKLNDEEALKLMEEQGF